MKDVSLAYGRMCHKDPAAAAVAGREVVQQAAYGEDVLSGARKLPGGVMIVAHRDLDPRL